ncbi:hypothetical protein TNCV_2801641 [Trichonephila clavipes]|nr:hypothetical protein TNCV_2801641 [Trichonephila clavipes]
MDIPYYPGIKATVYGIATYTLSHQGQSQTNADKAYDYCNSVLGVVHCFAGRIYATRNNGELRCLLHNSTKASKSIAKQTAQYDVKMFLVIHDNARPHISRTTRELI